MSGFPTVSLARLGDEKKGATVRTLLGQFAPSGSLWDAVASAALERAPLKPKAPVVVASLADFGISVAQALAGQGRALTAVIPESMSLERRASLLTYGVKLHPIPGGGSVSALQTAADALAKSSKAQRVSFTPADVAKALSDSWLEKKGELFVTGAGTGATFLAAKKRFAKVVLVTVAGPHHVQGFTTVEQLPDDVQSSEHLEVTGAEAWALRLRLAREAGILSSLSGAANVAAALHLAKTLPPGTFVDTVLWGSGEHDFSLSEYFA